MKYSSTICSFCNGTGKGKTINSYCSWCGGRGFSMICPSCREENEAKNDCLSCKGHGLVRFCPRCKGKGETFQAEYSRLARRWESCRLCNGTGFLPITSKS